MHKIIVLFFCLCFTLTSASTCISLSGKWRNELGSYMTIHDLEGSRYTGEYYTAVESKPGASAVASNITGIFVPVKGGGLVAFTVIFNHGESLTTWVGQCIVCDGKETLFTTYTYSRRMSKDENKWLYPVINQNTFQRVKEEDGGSVRRTRESNNLNELIFKDMAEATKDMMDLNGEWVSDNGNKIRFLVLNESSKIAGSYDGLSLTGHFEGTNVKAVGLSMSSSDSVRGWSGYISQTPLSSEHRFETAWLQHVFNDNCKDARKTVHFGMDNYRRINTDKNSSTVKNASFFEKIRDFFRNLF